MVVRRKLRLDTASGTKELIVEEAERLIAEKGVDNWRLADIAKPLGIKRPAIYAHFANREAVFVAVLDRAVEGLAVQFPYESGVEDPKTALVRGTRRFVLQMVQNPAQPRIWMRDLESPEGGLPELQVIIGGDHLTSLSKGRLGPMYRRIHGLLQDGYEMGQFRRADLVDFCRLVFGTTLFGVFFPTQDIFHRDGSAHVEHLQHVVEEVMLRYLRRD